ncbi:MAG: hypothetical protein LBP69_05370 [Treponema sp.]|jgi:hypothetical protein|nr:hypothetical protein [Treponema sp.]
MREKQPAGMPGKKTIIRGGLFLAWLLLGTLLFITGRGHTLLVDNRDFEHIEAPDLITVYVDRGWGVEYFRGDRDRLTLTGSKHRILVEFSDGSPPFEGNFTLPIRDDMYLLSVPKMVNGIEPFVEVFHTVPEPFNEEAEDEFGDGFNFNEDFGGDADPAVTG